MSESRHIESKEKIRYKRYNPQMYIPRMSIFWWAKQKPYILFIVRELTSVFIAAYMVLLIIQLDALRRGPEAWDALLASFAALLSVGLHVLIFVFVIFHSLTWFWISPTALVLRIGGRRIPGAAIITANVVLWILLSLAVVWVVLTA